MIKSCRLNGYSWNRALSDESAADRVAVSLGNNVEYAIVRQALCQERKSMSDLSSGYLRTLQDWCNLGSSKSNFQCQPSHLSPFAFEGFIPRHWCWDKDTKENPPRKYLASQEHCPRFGEGWRWIPGRLVTQKNYPRWQFRGPNWYISFTCIDSVGRHYRWKLS